ncbi:MAG: flagellar hook-associated protein 3 [Acidobacteriota bacterium]|nr:flagellar hook-associated protein 3 [Acidobacteriota bacterium]
MTSFDPKYLQSLSGSISQSTALEQSLTTELSSGLAISSLQDNPVAVAQSQLLGASIAQQDTFVQTASGLQSRLQVADSTLGEIVSQLTKAESLAVQGNGGTLSASNLQAVQQQLQGIQQQVLSLINTSYQGSFLFGGSQGSTAPFAVNSTTGAVTYSGDNAVTYVTTPEGQQIQTNLPGSAAFGTGASGVLGVLSSLIQDFAGSTPSTTAVSDSSALTSALAQVSAQRSVLGNSLSRIASASTYTQSTAAQLTAAQSSLVAADTARVATQLSMAETQHQALLNVTAALEGSGNSLFSYIK